MGLNLSRRHHYIPKMLLKNFCDDGRIWVGDRITKQIYPSTPRREFVEKDLYMRSTIDGPKSHKKSDEHEKTLSQIESDAAFAIRRIIERARCNQCPQLIPEDSNHWKRFMLAIARRTPESRARVMPESFDDIFYEAAKKVAEKDSYMGLPDKDSFYSDPHISKLKDIIKSNNDAMFAAGDHPFGREEVERFCRETGLSVVVIGMPNRSFVIGSHGLAIVQSSYKNDPAEGSWLPIAHDVAVKPTFSPNKESLYRLGRDSDLIIKRINRASATQSRKIAGRSKDLISSLMRGYTKCT